MSTEIEVFNFHGDRLDVVRLPGGDVGVSVRRVAEALGLDPDAQLARLGRTAATGARWATTSVVKVVAADGKNRDALFLPRRSLPMWAATVDVSRVRQDVRPKLLAYQDEAAEVLADHFLGPRVAPAPLPPANGKPLTKRQADVMEYLLAYRRQFGAPPSMREISAHFGMGSTNAVNDHLLAMEKKGVIRLRKDGRSRGIILPPEPPPPAPPPPVAPPSEIAELRSMVTQLIGAVAALAGRPRQRKALPSGQRDLFATSAA